MRARLLSVVLALTVLMPLAVRADRIDSELGPIEVTTIASGLRSPWAVAFLPDGRYLVTERGGPMRIVDADGRIGAARGRARGLGPALSRSIRKPGRVSVASWPLRAR